ncbi:hypothetical protein [Sphingobacterium anhuiense]|uniref:hypothetical protein n=1 Tax=Sphingobacterium anhuiense TaxID=493780 RepID=UPI003C2E5679
MFDKLFKKQEEVQSEAPKQFYINDYYGRFTLEEIDNEVEVIKLQKRLEEVRLDYRNNQANHEVKQDLRSRKQMNFCRFMIARISQRIEEIKVIESANSRILHLVAKTPEKRWKAIVEHVAKLYPGINLEEIILKTEK